jgi:voltage-gated potassium channel Kch
VVANAGFTQWLSSRGHTWTSILREFAAMTVVNTGIVLAYIVFLRRSDQPVDEGATLFFVLLITLIVTLFDRYRPIRVSGFAHDDAEVRPATADR